MGRIAWTRKNGDSAYFLILNKSVTVAAFVTSVKRLTSNAIN